MDIATGREAAWDPYDYDLLRNPHDAFRPIREEKPLYYNAEHDFYAVSRYADCVAGLGDRQTFRNGKGVMLEQIRSGSPMPRGLFNFEDPPRHTIHRGLLSRVFTVGRMAQLEPRIRAFCARILDPLIGAGGFDFVRDFSAKVPMRVIGMLLGIPEEDQDGIRRRGDDRLRTEAGKPMQYDGAAVSAGFGDYIDWRMAHPSDDIMSQLVQAEFEDETGARRRLTRAELGTMIGFLASAGNETTNRLIGWAGKLLALHPDQRRQLRDNPLLIPRAIEEVLRYEPPAVHIGRYVARDVELHGTTIAEGSVVIFLTGAANRDPRVFADPDRFDLHRERRPHLTFGHGHHVCLGNALARLEGRIALDEVLKRFPTGKWTWIELASPRPRRCAAGKRCPWSRPRRSFEVTVTSTKLTPRIGSELLIDRAALLGGAASAEIRALLEQRGVLIVRGIGLEDADLLAAAQTLGHVRLGTAVAKEGTDGIKPVTFDQSANPATAQYFKGTFFWHMDGTYDDVPPLAALLVPRILAPEGGETEFANTYAAYEDLSAADKRRIEGLSVEHTMAAAHRLYTPDPTQEQLAHWAKFPARRHPLVWRHRSGRRSLLLSSSVTRIVGMDDAEGQALLAELMAWATQPQYVYRHEWRLGDLLIWDNTGTMHRAMPFDLDCGRRLHRVTLEGEEAFATAG